MPNHLLDLVIFQLIAAFAALPLPFQSFNGFQGTITTDLAFVMVHWSLLSTLKASQYTICSFGQAMQRLTPTDALYDKIM